MEHYIFDYYTSRWRSKTHKSVKFPIRLWRHHKMGGGGLYIADDCNTNVRLFFCSPANLTRKKQKKKRRHKSVCNDICPPSLGLLEASFTSLLCACVCGGRGRSKNTSSYGCYQRPLFHDFFFPQFGGGFRHKWRPHDRHTDDFFFVVFFYDALGRDPNHVNASQIIKGKGRVLFCYKVLGEMSSISLTPISFLAWEKERREREKAGNMKND